MKFHNYAALLLAVVLASVGAPWVSRSTAIAGVRAAATVDTQPPTVPRGLAASNISAAGLTLAWNSSTDRPRQGGTGVGGYDVYRNGAQIAVVTSGTSYADSGLAAGVSYSYQVSAFDRATPVNTSALSRAISVTTVAVRDTQAPTVPSGLRASTVTGTSVSFIWTPSIDLPSPGGTGVGGYNVYRNGANIATVTATSYADSGLSGSTAYLYQVSAFDKATPPNVSTLSSVLNVTTSGQTLTISPHIAPLTLSQTQQFTSNATAGTTLTWAVDGIAGGNAAAVGTISGSGFYTPPPVPGTHTITATSTTNSSYTGGATVAVTNLTGITTYHADVARTGQNLQEYALTPSAVSSNKFGKRWSCAVDGAMYAQPLYVANVVIGGGTHNVLIVATAHDSVYAFDADSPGCVVFWKDSFTKPPSITTVASSDVNCTDVVAEYGIVGTPVIDPSTQTLYVVARTKENGSFFQRLHSLALTTGAERGNSPATIAANVPGIGDGGTTDAFNPLKEGQRTGLALSGGKVFIGWGSQCDSAPYYGWLMSYDTTSLTRAAVFNSTPNSQFGGIWMSGGAPAIDSSGNLFLSTGNGNFSDTSNVLPPLALSNDFGESFLHLDPTTLAVKDFYTPSQYLAWSNADLDIASAGVTVLPDGSGPSGHPNVFIGLDKQGHLWMIDRSNMSGFNSSADNTVQYLSLPAPNVCGDCAYGTPAYWNGKIYLGLENNSLMIYTLSKGLIPSISSTAVPSSISAETYGYPSPTPMISASPGGNAVVWVLDTRSAAQGGSQPSPAGPAILRAYDATSLATRLYSSDVLAADIPGNAIKFTVPVVANGHVYVGGDGVLTVYGLAP